MSASQSMGLPKGVSHMYCGNNRCLDLGVAFLSVAFGHSTGDVVDKNIQELHQCYLINSSEVANCKYFVTALKYSF